MKYTVIPGVILAKICDEDVLIATGPARGKVAYVKGLNVTGAYFFSKLAEGTPVDQIIEDASAWYNTPKNVIEPSFRRFLHSLMESGYLREMEE